MSDGMRSDEEMEYLEYMGGAYIAGQQGDMGKAFRFYEKAESLGMCEISPQTQMLRFREGEAKGNTRAVTFTEDNVLMVEVERPPVPFDTEVESFMPEIDREVFIQNIQRYSYPLRPYHHNNIKSQMDHIMVMSTGRCGTVSLMKLFEGSDYIPHHAFAYNIPISDKHELMCRMMTKDSPHALVDGGGANNWLVCRSAEWLGAMDVGHKYMGINHMDTIFAPLFATLHSLSRFIYLHRNPEDIFRSFYSKNQWSLNQLHPVEYTDYPVSYRYIEMSEIENIAWYIRFTEEFSRAMGDVMGDRWIEVSANKLFAGNQAEISTLLAFTDAGISLETALEHFKTPVNEKKHKVKRDPEPMMGEFRKFYRKYGGVL